MSRLSLNQCRRSGFAVLLLAVGLALSPAFALDNTQSNDFWDTTAYVNPSPSVESGTLSVAVDAVAKTERPSNVLSSFFSTVCKGLISIFQ